ncbi:MULTISPECIES: hypothetical protein [Rhodococcus]|uniref:Uncharacterized protein n=1 Tax=Rhodococcus maanshanensis TaxID=183556 RepID=A0A1H7I9D3_9NOCA|nr:hypothetical protein [Rhodococcus maanshanensis]SEK59038.1 hypothetical protein SAMN05444583_102366 [Rhodococcus maanshanensis]
MANITPIAAAGADTGSSGIDVISEVLTGAGGIFGSLVGAFSS